MGREREGAMSDLFRKGDLFQEQKRRFVPGTNDAHGHIRTYYVSRRKKDAFNVQGDDRGQMMVLQA